MRECVGVQSCKVRQIIFVSLQSVYTGIYSTLPQKLKEMIYLCYGSDPEFFYLGSRISDPTTAAKEEEEKNMLSYLFLKAQISQNCKLCYCGTCAEENLSKLKKNVELSTQKLSLSSQKYGLGI
jgi:hypothetical protein